MTNRWSWLAVVGATLLVACEGGGNSARLVARVGDHTLTVDQVVKLIDGRKDVPNQPTVVRAVANLWGDYTLLADEVARDSTLKDVALEPLIRQQLDQETIYRLRDSVIHVDTAISDAELKKLYEKEAPGVRLRASHILFTLPRNASQAQRDSVRSLAEAVRKRAVAGENFAALARKYSQDEGTASKGGELGSFGRGDLAPALEKVAFALEPGQISDVVQSPYGLHIIRLESRTVPDFAQMRDSFRIKVQNQRYMKADSTYVAKLEAEAQPKVSDDAVAIVRAMAKDPDARLSSRAAQRPLVSYRGGALTVGQLQLMLQSGSDQQQFNQSVQGATDEQIKAFLHGLMQRDLLVAEARKVGLAPSEERVDSLVSSLRGELLEVAQQLGLRTVRRAPGEAMAAAVDRAVMQSIQDILSGSKNVVPLGPISFQLRARRPLSVYDAGVRRVVAEVGGIRAKGSSTRKDSIRPEGDTTGPTIGSASVLGTRVSPGVRTSP